MPAVSSKQRNQEGRGRCHKACKRCHARKIKCSGYRPCEPCKRKGLECNVNDKTEKVPVTRRYIDDLLDKVEALEHKIHIAEPLIGLNCHLLTSNDDEEINSSDYSRAFQQSTTSALDMSSDAKNKARAPLTNPLALHTNDWAPGPGGLPVSIGTSSNWAFGRRILTMTYERLLHTPMPITGLLFDATAYDLKWNGERNASFQGPTLPTQSLAAHLINSFKFHCGDLFHLFEEQKFMTQFYRFYEDPEGRSSVSTLWYIHYLLILAFGQALVSQASKVQRPASRDLFLHAMRLMPDFAFFNADPIESIQVLACAALYLQSIGHRPAAYQSIGRAISIALEHGMHTEMRSQYLDEVYIERCRKTWWTIYILERRTASLLGVPMAVPEQSISALAPKVKGSLQSCIALQLQVKLAQALTIIDQTVYGIEGKLHSRYLHTTQSVLKRIAHITKELNESFDINVHDNDCGISRISAHLHIQQHHCIILTTRPLLYIFLESKLGRSETFIMRWLQTETIHCLLRICVESAQQTITILSNLLDQGLLETFLPFDLDATFSSAIVLLIAAAVDPTLLLAHSPWSQRAYAILDEMDTRGNSIAGMTLSELKTLDSLLDRLSPDWEVTIPRPSSDQVSSQMVNMCITGDINTQSWDTDLKREFGLCHGLNAEQLMLLANSLDQDSWECLLSDLADSPAPITR